MSEADAKQTDAKSPDEKKESSTATSEGKEKAKPEIETVEGADVTHFDDGAPLLPTMPEVQTETGEENEEPLWTNRAKLFRYDSEEKAWKERGTGTAKLLQHKETKKIRFLMRRDATLKLCANHLVLPEMELKPLQQSDRAWMWHTAADLSEETSRPETLACRFPAPDQAQAFKDQFEAAKKQMKELLGD